MFAEDFPGPDTTVSAADDKDALCRDHDIGLSLNRRTIRILKGLRLIMF
jgi:hypothetical protein